MRVASLISGWMLVSLVAGPVFGARVGLVVERAGDEVTVSYPTWPGDTAKLERSSDLQNWSEVSVVPMFESRYGEKRRVEHDQPAFYRLNGPASGRFEALVADAATERRVTNVAVGLFRSSEILPTLAVSTDETGFFEFPIPENLQPPYTILQIVAPGYVERREVGTFNAGHPSFGKVIYLVPEGYRHPNDNWADAKLLGPNLAASGNTVGATVEPGEPHISEGNQSLWWKWIPAKAGTFYLDSQGTIASARVYVGESLRSLVSVWSLGASSTNFGVEAGKTYYIRVSKSNAAGHVEFHVRERLEITPSNDDFAQATKLLPLEDAKLGTNRVATLESGEPLAFAEQTGRTLWYRWTPTHSGRFRIHTSGSAFDTALAVYVGTELTNLTLVASNDNASLNVFTSALILEATQNETYYIAVDGMRGAWGALEFRLRGPEVADVPGPVPTSFAGKNLSLLYQERFRELFEFSTETTGIYHQGIDTFTYNYIAADRRIVLTRRNAAGRVQADYDITLEFDAGSSNRGSAVVRYIEPTMFTTDPARFEFF